MEAVEAMGGWKAIYNQQHGKQTQKLALGMLSEPAIAQCII